MRRRLEMRNACCRNDLNPGGSANFNVDVIETGKTIDVFATPQASMIALTGACGVSKERGASVNSEND